MPTLRMMLFALLSILAWIAPGYSDVSVEARQAADRLVIEGKQLGDAGRVLEAIERFKAAETKYPRAIHGCNIGLAYAQLKSYPQALLFLEQCRSRATGPMPAWVEARYQRTLETLRQGGYSAVEIVTDPTGAEVQIAGFGKDETFVAPRTVWLSSGEAEFVVSREGYVSQHRTLTLSSQTQRLEVNLVRVPTAIQEPVKPTPVETTTSVVPATTVNVLAPAPSASPPRGRFIFKVTGSVLFGVGALAAAVAWVPSYLGVDKVKVPVGDPKYNAYKEKQRQSEHVTYPIVFVTTGIVALAGVGILVAGFRLPAPKSKTVSFRLSPELGGGSIDVEGRF